MKYLFPVLILCLSVQMLIAGGQQEGAASSTHGKYLAGQGIIVPPEDIRINGYIAQLDYDYPTPTDDELNILLYHGNRQLSNIGQNEILQIGIKAAKVPFEDLPPLNLAFVIDKSGSMNSGDKLGWVKESFDIFINKVRDIDYVSLIVFSSESEILFPSTQMNNAIKREEFRKTVHAIEAGGGTNLVAGLEDGYGQILANYRSDYNNRVLFLTDGVGENAGIIEMAETYKDMGINVSTIGVGTNFDVDLMIEIAKSGGGSSRFISDREEMKETFGEELDRMIVPAARNLKMKLKVPPWVEILDTWGYRNVQEKHEVNYFLPTLHNGDYETILAEVEISRTEKTGQQEIGSFLLEYETISGEIVEKGPFPIEAEMVEESFPVFGVSDYTVLQSSTMLMIARSMIEIGDLYYQTKGKIDRLNSLRDQIWNSQEKIETEDIAREQTTYEALTSEEIVELENDINLLFRQALDKTVETRKIVTNNRLRLDNIGFDDELLILDQYIEILGKELNVNEENMNLIKDDIEITPYETDRTIHEHMDNLFREVNLSLTVEQLATLAIVPFVQQGSKESLLTELLNQIALDSLSRNKNITVLDRSNLDSIIEEQKLSLSGLVDTNKALEIGQLLSAKYMLTGNVIPMSHSIVIFARVINVETGEVESVSQVIVPISEEIKEMLM